MVFFMFSSTFVVLALFVSAFLLRAVYRLTLHPLAQYLGPFSGMVPSAYGMSYDFSSRSRGYILELPKLHDKHGAKYPSHAPGRDILISLIGPTIRIQPNELHIRDLDGYYQVFRPGTPVRQVHELLQHRSHQRLLQHTRLQGRQAMERYIPAVILQSRHWEVGTSHSLSAEHIALKIEGSCQP